MIGGLTTRDDKRERDNHDNRAAATNVVQKYICAGELVTM